MTTGGHSAKMKKFTLKGVLDGLRSSVSTPPKSEMEIEESLRSEHFQVRKTVRHGFPYQPTAMAYDPVQRLLAIGTKGGSLRIFGRPGVDFHIKHEGDVAVTQILFLANEGALVTACSDDQLHLWNFRQKKPEIVHSLKFQRERLTCIHLPFQSKWLYAGTERGNVHIVNIESFVLSGYIINWNKAIELTRKTHPGPVMNLSDCPIDPNKVGEEFPDRVLPKTLECFVFQCDIPHQWIAQGQLLIGFESGMMVLWDLKSKSADCRFVSTLSESLRSVSWHHEGKQFMCSHSDGTITIWNTKTPQKPHSVLAPHAKVSKDGKQEACKPITKVEWKSVRNNEPFIIFSGGMPYDKACRTPSVTVMHGKATTVLEMEHNVIDFITLVSTPWNNDFQDPYGIVVLLQNDLVVVDLTSPGYPCFENPYPMDIHESPVTTCQYFADCPPDLIPAFYSVGSRQKRTGYSEREWPIKGGKWGSTNCSYPEIIITGHADGSVKFWDASSVTLQFLYKLKTAKVFERHKAKSSDEDDDPYALQHLHLCPESRILCVAGATHVVIFRFSKQEANVDTPTIEVTIAYEIYDELDSPEVDYPPIKPSLSVVAQQQSGSVGSYSSNASEGKESQTCVKVKPGGRKWSSGYQPDLCCLMTWIDGEPPPPITSLSVNSSYGLLAFGNECGLAIVDMVQKTCLLNMGTPDLYGSMDPYQRAPRSPKNRKPGEPGLQGLSQTNVSDDTKSPTSDQIFFSLSDQESNPPKSPSTRYKAHSHNSMLEAIRESSPSKGDASTMATIDTAASLDCLRLNDVDKSPTTLEPDSPDGRIISISCEALPTTDSAVTDNKESDGSEEPIKVVYRKKRNSGSSKEPRSKHVRSTTCASLQVNEFKKQPLSRTKSDNQRTALAAEMSETRKVCKSENDVYALNLELLNNNNKFTFEPVKDANEDGSVTMTTTTSKDQRGSKTLSGIRRMSKKIKSSIRRSSLFAQGSDEDEDEEDGLSVRERLRLRRFKKICFDMVDLRSDECKDQPKVKHMTYDRIEEMDKNDGSFSRSRSSSMSSLENINKEPIQCLSFADAYTRKTDSFTCPCLWVGTSLGSVLVIVLNLPPPGEQRMTQPVIVSPSGTIFRLKGAILAMSFLDCNGVLIPSISEAWKDANREERERRTTPRTIYELTKAGQQSVSSNKPRISPTQSTEQLDRQFAIICSEQQARVMSLPSQTCAYKVKITDTSFVTKADVVSMKDSVCLACYVANGHIMTFSLPSLKPLMDMDFLPLTDLRIAKTFCFSNSGHALYFCSPSELQKITLSTDMCDNLGEMIGELFLPSETPEAPKQSFFKNLFTPSSSQLDREELFGEASGKASRGVAKYTAGMAQAQERAVSATSEIGRAYKGAIERGEKLGELDERTQQMAKEAEVYAKNARKLMEKYKDKKWYQF